MVLSGPFYRTGISGLCPGLPDLGTAKLFYASLFKVLLLKKKKNSVFLKNYNEFTS